jgi:SAM-dependent methyltransferase
MSRFQSLTSILSVPSAYRLFTRLVTRDGWRIHVDEHVKPLPGEKVLDIGCGPADILNYLPNVNYTGVDISPDYIEAAKKRFGERGRFLCGDVGELTIEKEKGTFSLVLATGVVHHLDDQTAGKLFELAKLALGPNGRLVTYDGCYIDGQSPVARWLLGRDRGKFVRVRDEYERLAACSFKVVLPKVRQDLLRIPYTHLIMRCSN